MAIILRLAKYYEYVCCFQDWGFGLAPRKGFNKRRYWHPDWSSYLPNWNCTFKRNPVDSEFPSDDFEMLPGSRVSLAGQFCSICFDCCFTSIEMLIYAIMGVVLSWQNAMLR